MFFPRGNASKLFNSGRQPNRGSPLLVLAFQLAFQKEPVRVLNYWETLISDSQMWKEFRIHILVHRDGALDINLQSALCLHTWITTTKDSFLLFFIS